MEMVQRFPPIGGPLAVRGLASPYITGYSVGAHVTYVALAGSVGTEAYDAMPGLTQKHRAGFCHVSGDNGGVPPWTPPAA